MKEKENIKISDVNKKIDIILSRKFIIRFNCIWIILYIINIIDRTRNVKIINIGVLYSMFWSIASLSANGALNTNEKNN